MKSKIVNKLMEIEDLLFIEGCTKEQLQVAQEQLQVNFPKEYEEYVRRFGTITFGSTEWLGLNTDSYLNVVSATLNKRKEDQKFPKDVIIIEDMGIDGILSVMNSNGEVFYYQAGKMTRISKNLLEYVTICLNREQEDN